MNKAELRSKMKDIRKNLPERLQKNNSIRERALKLLERYASVFSYVSFGSEVDTLQLIDKLSDSGKKICIPYTNDDIMSVKVLENVPENIAVDKFGNIGGIEKLKDADFMSDCALIPMLAFNRALFRLGYGGGYYDRFLKTFNGVKIGLAYDEQYCLNFFEEEHDVALDLVVTPTAVFGRELTR